MAMLKSLLGVEVAITVDGESLPEYEDPEATDMPDDLGGNICTPLDRYDSMTRYVETQPDRNFQIKIITKQGSTRGAGLEFSIVIDASIADRLVVRSRHCADRDSTCYSVGWRISDGPKFDFAPYKFTKSQLKEDNQWREPDEILGNLGLIEVQVYHLFTATIVTGYPNDRAESNTPDVISHKAAAIGVDYTASANSDIIEDLPLSVVKTRYASQEPIAIFRFRYRSLEILRVRGIVPQAPVEDRDAATMTLEDIIELQRRFKAEREENEFIKAERES